MESSFLTKKPLYASFGAQSSIVNKSINKSQKSNKSNRKSLKLVGKFEKLYTQTVSSRNKNKTSLSNNFSPVKNERATRNENMKMI
jgi:hypothetical protein